MTSEELLARVRAGDVHVSWGHLNLIHKAGHQLRVAVFRDAMKFDRVPAMRWTRKPVPVGHPDRGKTYDGVRLPVTAVEMQQIADLTGCMMLTPKIVDEIWLAAGLNGLQIDSVVNVHGIVAEADIHVVHAEIEKQLAAAKGNSAGIVDSVGKYWVICNAMLTGKFSAAGKQAVNYGWPTRGKGNRPGVTGKFNVWQPIGGEHSTDHYDPSQTIRLMSRTAYLLRAGTSTRVEVDLHDIARDPELCSFISHEGPLKVLRQQGVPEPKAVLQPDGTYLLPEVVIFGDPPTGT